MANSQMNCDLKGSLYQRSPFWRDDWTLSEKVGSGIGNFKRVSVSVLSLPLSEKILFLSSSSSSLSTILLSSPKKYYNYDKDIIITDLF